MLKILVLLVTAVHVCLIKCDNLRSFSIDYDTNTFVKDGKPFRYISGSIHYSRVLYQSWDDRLQKMAAAGLDAIQVYIPWNLHEPEPGTHDFEGQQNLTHFLQLAADNNLLVLLRPGPYICAEWEYGGFPYWLKRDNDSIVLRSMDPGYIRPVTEWFRVLLPMIEPMLYVNGGPIIMVQVENEYGSYQGVICDHGYMAYLRDMFRRYLGNGVVLYTTDGCSTDLLKCGAIDGVYATVDFGPGDANAGFTSMRKWNPQGPLINSEYYSGWLDHWNSSWAYVNTNVVIKTLKEILDLGASVNMYMFEGGTNFGFMNGADPTYQPVVTSYDYDAPLSEAGDITNKYLAIRNLIQIYKPVPSYIPSNTTKMAYGKVNMLQAFTLFEAVRKMSAGGVSFETIYPVTMETAHQAYGFAWYRTKLNEDFPLSEVNFAGVQDRGYVLLDGILQGVVYRNTQTSLQMAARAGTHLDILVENMGRINYGAQINHNKKGIISNITWNGRTLTGWQFSPLNQYEMVELATTAIKFRGSVDMKYPNNSPIQPTNNSPIQPTVFQGRFRLAKGSNPADTFLNVCGWSKGVALLNDFNLGRYWPVVGPQVTLFVPGTTIKPYPNTNSITMLELEASPCSTDTQVKGHTKSMDTTCSVEFMDKPILGAKCTSQGKVIMLERREMDTTVNYNKRRSVGT